MKHKCIYWNTGIFLSILSTLSGESSSGKSSFLNLLMGTKALPAAHMSCTFVVTVIQYGPEQVATVHGYNKDNIKTIKEADPVAFYKAIEEVLFEKGDRTTQSQYRQVDIQVPLSYLKVIPSNTTNIFYDN